MSYDDNRPNDPRDRGAYTPPTDDDLPFNRGAYDARRPGGGGGAPPVTLIVSALVLLVLIVAVVLFYRSGLRASNDAPPAVGTPVGELTVEAPVDAQPIDPEAGINVYRDDAADTALPTFTPGPETPQPRPVPQPSAPIESGALPPVAAPRPAAPAPTAPAPATRPAPVTAAPAEKAPPAPAATAGGSSAVQIGAFSSRELADREYAAVAARFPQFASGRTKRVEQVTTSSGSTVYRTTFAGFSRADAQAFCSALRAAGRDCLVR